VHYNPYFDPYAGHKYVEIGGLKWATMNVGAESETDYGLYFQWGDTQGYTASQVGSGTGQKAFSWADYKFNPSGDGETFTKYTGSDGKTALDIEDDAARANMGGQWRMPTTSELQALGNAVNTAWTTDYQSTGIKGIVCTAKDGSGAQLFFPAAGYCGNGSVYRVGSYGYYWSSSLDSGDVLSACYLGFISSGVYWDGDGGSRYCGFSVRGVVG
jgi:hypothetical protein